MRILMRSVGVLLAVTSAAQAATSGKAIYTANCAGCHAPTGAGMVGPNLKEAAGWSYVLFKRAMLQGKDDKGVVFKAPMPVWGKVGFAGDHGKAPTAAELKALQAYLNTLKFK